MRFAALLVEHLPICVETLCDTGLITKPVVILRAWDDRVIDASTEANSTGISHGDSRQRVEQLCPQAVILTAREELYQTYHNRLRSILLNFANAVETADLGELLIEIGALARAFPSEADLALQVLQHVEDATHLQPTIGIASNKFTAQRAARPSNEQAGRIVIVTDGQERHFLAALPLNVLPDLPVEMARRLHLFGLTTLGGLAQLPHAAVTLQFGSEWAIYHNLARGIDPRPLIPQMPPPSIGRTLTPLEPIHDRAMLLIAVERLATRIAQRLSETGYQVLALSVNVTTAMGDELATGAPVKPPSSDAEQLRRLTGRLLGKLAIEADVSRVTVIAYPLREWHHSARQLTLLDAPLQAGLLRLQTAIKVIKQRFGEAVIRLASLIGPPVPLAIKVMAQPDGLPTALSWGGWSRQVKTVWNIWREQGHWWDQPVARHYYQLEVSDGALYTVFCDEHGGWFMDRRRR